MTNLTPNVRKAVLDAGIAIEYGKMPERVAEQLGQLQEDSGKIEAGLRKRVAELEAQLKATEAPPQT